MPRPPRTARSSALAAALLAAILSPAGAARAATEPGDPVPAVGAPLAVGARGNVEHLVDGRVAGEGARWDAAAAIVLDASRGELRIDLGAPRELRSALLQADADDSYALEGSLDGERFVPLATAPALPGLAGLRTRALVWPATPVRWVRLRPGAGDGRASVSELQLFSVDPAAWRSRLETVNLPADRESGTSEPWWNDRTSRIWELALALLALLLLALERGSGRGGKPRRKRLWNALFAALFGLAVLTYFNFGAFHFGNYLHNWDTFHYYVGAKYFPELGYDGLYDCVAVADFADPARRRRAEERKIRDLRRNELVSTREILAHPARCTDRFSPARWRSFEADVAWFRARENPTRWDEMSADHGFNATPVWMVAGTTLANLAPAGTGSIGALTLLDPLYFLALAAVLVWGFGLRTATVALLVLATSFPSRFFWTGGAFLRWDWLFYLAAAAALLRRGHALAAGAALGYAALLRIFPLLFAAGPAIGLALAAARALRTAEPGRRLRSLAGLAGDRAARPLLTFFGGMLLAAALLVPASFVVTGGASTWSAFAANTAKHGSTPLTNNMGLAMALTYRPDEIGRRLHSDDAAEPWARWKEARLAARSAMLPLQALLALAVLALLTAAIRRHPEPWIGLALSAAFLSCAIEMTCYYYAFLVIPALLWSARQAAGAILLALSATGQLLSLAPLDGMPVWRDELYTALSVATVLALAAILVLFALRPAAPRSVPAAGSGCPSS